MTTRPPVHETVFFADDGSVPNNQRLPFVLYRNAIDLSGTPNPEEVIERRFRDSGWGDLWRNGIYEYLHYHSTIHEVMGVARGRARVMFGGSQGREFDLAQDDVVVLPAGTGHQSLWASPDLTVIGAYPPGGRYDLCRGSKAEHAKAVETIPHVPLPKSDPAYGTDGPLLRLWRV
jgi:uncharacterized protein YjlB